MLLRTCKNLCTYTHTIPIHILYNGTCVVYTNALYTDADTDHFCQGITFVFNIVSLLLWNIT